MEQDGYQIQEDYSMNERVKYFIMGVFGEYNPKVSAGHSRNYLNAEEGILLDRNAVMLKDKGKMKNFDEIQDYLNSEYINLCLITHDQSALEKEKLSKIILMAKRSLVIDLSDPMNNQAQIENLLRQFLA